jgi:hypothetical protein
MPSRIFDPRDPQLVASVSTTQDARNAGRRNERTVEDSRDFREIRSLMNNRWGVCG